MCYAAHDALKGKTMLKPKNAPTNEIEAFNMLEQVTAERDELKELLRTIREAFVAAGMQIEKE